MDNDIPSVWLVPAWLIGMIIGLVIGIIVMNGNIGPSEAFRAVCEDRGGVVYGEDGCFNPDDAVYVEDDK